MRRAGLNAGVREKARRTGQTTRVLVARPAGTPPYFLKVEQGKIGSQESRSMLVSGSETVSGPPEGMRVDWIPNGSPNL